MTIFVNVIWTLASTFEVQTFCQSDLKNIFWTLSVSRYDHDKVTSVDQDLYHR